MGKYLFLFLLILPCFLSAQENDSITTERYDFSILEGYNRAYMEKSDGQRVAVYNLGYREYPLDSSYYCINKIFYPSGILKEKGKLIPPSLKIGEWKYYDEQGHLTRIVDEDARFGKIKPEDIQMFAKKKSFLAEGDTYYNVIVKYPSGRFEEKRSASIIKYNENENIWTLHISCKSTRDIYRIDGDSGEIYSLTINYRFELKSNTIEFDGETIFNFPPPDPPERLTRPKKQINRIKERERPRPR